MIGPRDTTADRGAPALEAPAARPAERATAPVRPASSLRIERLVLDGFRLSAPERARLQAALEAEWTVLVHRHALHPAIGGAVPAVRAEDVRFDQAADVERLGRAIARSVYAELWQ